MRVIAGIYRSRPLMAPKGLETRPTSDRLRETLFNVLAPRIAGSRFVDLYAGTGAVGIEAMSRGAEHVWFAEKAAPAIAAMRANLSALKIVGGYTLESRGVGAMLERLGKLSQPMDIVFLDPPYEAEAEYAGTLQFLGSVRGRGVLAADAVVIAEHGSKAKLADRYGALEQTRRIKQGDAALSFFAFPVEEVSFEPVVDESLRLDDCL
ncbi:16S rRNA (guanine(966)-N(2))-methyltransferase RsmD [Edaphobacter aggregans]|uniref:16S rRNA (Guanine(966)-N(2))-methyltransferase RsmD n=1 Tax=Edaphobacter aggregans TaxID=570835 RepID=A0A428MG50_9BACT|nr:16S rRNA (guanine(966)-N(2))-methyltransferase RsmD [Edaphobacter aggregans]RSL15729.1 16S rRNA (guanine(966)-N(2))-methyltransferase RsmD [Edaphobacter aggregans]